VGETIIKKPPHELVRLLMFYFLNSFAPKISVNKNNTRKMKKSTFAIDAAPAEIPVKPNNPATMATTRNIKVQRNIILYFKGL